MRAHAPNLEGDRAGSVAWARRLAESEGFCVLDSETTGLKPPVGFVEIAIVDSDAKTLFESTVKPGCPIEPGATRIHGHTTRSLAGSPPFWKVYPELLEALWGRRVIVYNAPYDRRVWDAAGHASCSGRGHEPHASPQSFSRSASLGNRSPTSISPDSMLSRNAVRIWCHSAPAPVTRDRPHTRVCSIKIPLCRIPLRNAWLQRQRRCYCGRPVARGAGGPVYCNNSL